MRREFRVLIVDDSVTIRAMLDTIIATNVNFRAAWSAASCSEAKEILRRRRPDVVTLDINMPDMNGLDFLDEIMATRPLPVVILSSEAVFGDEICNEAIRRGAVTCFDKADCVSDHKRLVRTLVEASEKRFTMKHPVQVMPTGRVNESFCS